MKDIIGSAVLDYFHGNYSEDIYTETNISEEDVLPLPYLFRSYTEMPALEQKALQLAQGHVLDVGCGAGSHGLYLQKKGLKVTAIDTSQGAVTVAKERGLQQVKMVGILDFSEEKFDTLLLLMNGTGIFQKLTYVSKYLTHLKTLLQPDGQILIDSSDLRYMYDTSETDSDGNEGIWVPGAMEYYGELEFTMRYKGASSEPFYWLYLDEQTFQNYCTENGYHFEVISRGENYDYLARLTVAEYTPY